MASPVCFDLFYKSEVMELPWHSATRSSPHLESVIAQTPAIGHQATLAAAIGIGRSGSMQSRGRRLWFWSERRYTHGGDSRSNYLYPIFESGYKLRGAGSLTFLFSPSLLRRSDYFYSYDPAYGSFMGSGLYGAPKSFTPDHLNLKDLKASYELPFENSISVKEYAVALVVPRILRRPFQTLSLMNGISWRRLGVKVIYSDSLPTLDKMFELSAQKIDQDVSQPEYREPHISVREDVEYNLPSFMDRVSYLQSPEAKNTDLGRTVAENLLG